MAADAHERLPQRGRSLNYAVDACERGDRLFAQPPVRSTIITDDPRIFTPLSNPHSHLSFSLNRSFSPIQSWQTCRNRESKRCQGRRASSPGALCVHGSDEWDEWTWMRDHDINDDNDNNDNDCPRRSRTHLANARARGRESCRARLRLFIDWQVWPNTDTLHSRRSDLRVPYQQYRPPLPLALPLALPAPSPSPSPVTLGFIRSPGHPCSLPRLRGFELRARAIFRITVVIDRCNGGVVLQG